MTSNREKKRIVTKGVRDLVSRGGWDTRRFESGTTGIVESARNEIRDAVVDDLYSQAGLCRDCLAARADTGDPTALCDRHMKEALGMT